MTHAFAEMCAMRKHNIVLRLDVVGQKGESCDSCYYIFELVMTDGSTKRVWAYGMEKIMEPSEPVDLSLVRHLFPHVPGEVFDPRPSKDVDILMGTNFLGLHPNGGKGRDTVGDLVAFESGFGLGWVIGGTHPSLQSTTSRLSPYAINFARMHKCVIAPELLPSFWEDECSGVQSPRRCGKCSRCKECTGPALGHSRKVQDVLDLMKPFILLIFTIIMFYTLLNQGMLFLMVFLLVEQVLTSLLSFKQVSTMFNSKKWKKEYFMRVGENMMLRFHKQFKNDYSLAKVTEANPDEDGDLRKVTVTYRQKNLRVAPHINRLGLTEEVVPVSGEVGVSVDSVHGQVIEGDGVVQGQVVGQVGEGGNGAPVHDAG